MVDWLAMVHPGSSWRGVSRPFLCVLLFVSLSGCAGNRAPLRIGVNSWPPCEVWYVAEKLGYFGNVPVKIVRFSIWSDNMTSLYKGNLDITHATYLNALYFADKGEKARIILSADTILGVDGLVVKNALKNGRSLRGRRVAVEANTDEHFLLRKALETYGLAEADLTIAATSSKEAAEMFIAGEVEATFNYEPFLSEAAAKGDGRILWTTRDLPGYMVDVLVASEKSIRNRRRDLRVVLAAWYKAQDYIRANPRESFALMAEKEGMSPEEFAAFYGSFEFFSARENLEIFASSRFRKVLAEMNDFLLSHRAIRKHLDVEELFIAEFAGWAARAR